MVLLGIFMEFRNMHHFIFKNKIVSIPNTRESELKTSAPSLYKYLIFFSISDRVANSRFGNSRRLVGGV